VNPSLKLPARSFLLRALASLAASVQPRQQWLDETVRLVQALTGAGTVAIYTKAPGGAMWTLVSRV
jgi:hypothetical protein